MIQPEGIPVEDLNAVASALEEHLSELSALGQPFTDLGIDIHSTFQGLTEVYEAPERELLVGSTLKIKTNLDEFGPSLPAMTGHLATLADELRSRARDLGILQIMATSLRESAANEEDWRQNPGLVDLNNGLVARVNEIMTEEVPDLCFTAANEIVKLHGGDTWDPETGLREGEEAPPAPDDAAEPEPPPWGTAEDVDYPPWQDVLMFPGNVVIGVVTVLAETVEGILTLVPVLPALGKNDDLRDWLKDTFDYDLPTMEDTENAWRGVGMLVLQVGAAPTQFGAWVGEELFGIERSEEVKESTDAGLDMIVEMGDSFVAWDEWAKNPGKALGMVAANVFLTVGTLGAGAGIKAAALAGRYGVMAARAAKAADFIQGLRVTAHDAALGAALKIPTVRDVVNGLSEIPLLGDNFKFHGVPPVDVPANTPDLPDTSNTPDGTDSPPIDTTPVDSPSVDTSDFDVPDSTHTPTTDSTPTQTDPGTTTPGWSTDPGTTTPVWHTDPRTTTPGWHGDPVTTTPGSSVNPSTTTPGSHTVPSTTTPTNRVPDTTTTPGTRTPDSTTTPGTRTPDSTTSPGTRTPDSKTTPGTRTPDSATTRDTRTPETSRTPESNSPNTPEKSRTPESNTPNTPEKSRTSETSTSNTPETSRTPETNTPNTPQSSRKPESNTPGTRTPESTPTTRHTPEPAAPRNVDPAVPPVMPMHPGVPSHAGTPSTPNVPGATPNTPNTPHTPNGPRPDQEPWRPFDSPQQHPLEPPPSRHPQPNKPTHAATDAANDPKYDDPLARQVELDKMKPDYLQPGPNKPRSLIDRYDHIPPDPLDPRKFELRDAVGDDPVGNVTNWAHKVNPDNGFSDHYGMNCPDVSRANCEILNDEPPRLAAGNRFASGESPDTTLEWMGLSDVPAANKFDRPPGRDGDWSLDQAAYQKVRDALNGRPVGTHANIGVYYVGGGGHRFTAFVDTDKSIKWLDTQPSEAARKLPDGSPEQLAAIRRDMVKDSDQIPLASHIAKLDFAVRERGGAWEGVPRTHADPPASQTRFGAPRPIHGSETPGTPDGSHTPEGLRELDDSGDDGIFRSEWDDLTELNPPSPDTPEAPDPDAPDVPDAHVPDGPDVPDAHVPDAPDAPEMRAPESRLPEADAPVTRVQEAHAPVQYRSVETPARPDGGPFARSALADRRFRASDQDVESYRATLGSTREEKMLEHKERARAQELGHVVDDLSNPELSAMDEMLGMKHQDINKDYRNGDPSVEQNPLVRVAASALHKLPDFKGEIHRGLTFDTPEALQAFLDRYVPGATVREPAFQHSAKTEGGAHVGSEHSVGKVVVHIDARHGKDVSFLRPPRVFVDEVMHPPHTTFYPTRKTTYDTDNKTYHVYVRDHGGPASVPASERVSPVAVEADNKGAYYRQQYGQSGQHQGQQPQQGGPPQQYGGQPQGQAAGSGPEGRSAASERNAGYEVRELPDSEFVSRDEPKAEAAYRRIRELTHDVPKIAEQLGIDPTVVDVAKQNLFVNQHHVSVASGDIVKGNFTADEYTANLWKAGMNGTLKGDEGEPNELRSLIAHEYVEAKLMAAGVPYNFADGWTGEIYPDTREVAGAHTVAPRPLQATDNLELLLRHWETLGLTPPPGGIAPDLSNLDDIVHSAIEGMDW